MTHPRSDEQASWAPRPMIPGERDPANLTHREPGAMGGRFTGDDIPHTPPRWLDQTTAHERAREGGGDAGGRAAREREKREKEKGEQQ